MSFPKEESVSSTNSIKDDQIRRTQLQMQFHGTRREDFQTIEAYVKKLKSVAESLAEIGDQISDSDMVLQLLAGLPNEYLPLKQTISSRVPLPNFEQACSMLHMQEHILLQDHKEQITTDPDVVGAEQSFGFCTVDKFVSVVETVNTFFVAKRTVDTVLVAAGTLGLGSIFAASLGGVIGAVATVGASRMIVLGAASAVAGWKIHQAFSRRASN